MAHSYLSFFLTALVSLLVLWTSVFIDICLGLIFISKMRVGISQSVADGSICLTPYTCGGRQTECAGPLCWLQTFPLNSFLQRAAIHAPPTSLETELKDSVPCLNCAQARGCHNPFLALFASMLQPTTSTCFCYPWDQGGNIPLQLA